MPVQISPPLRRRRLAGHLRRLREQAGLSLEEAAKRLDKTRSTLGRIEQGKTKADVHLVRTMMDIYDVRDDNLLDLARQAAKKGWWQAYPSGKGRGRGYLEWETEACEKLDLELLYIPGLLQTEAYMRELFRLEKHGRTDEQVESAVAERMHRRHRLTDTEAPLTFVGIVDESALHRPIGGPAVMRAQLRYLVERAEVDTVTLQVLPWSPQPHSCMTGSFSLLRFPEGEDPDVLFVPYPVGALHLDVKGAEEVKEARLLFERLRSEALSPRESVAFVEKLARDLYP